MMGVITFILTVAALKLGKSVLLPVVFSVFLALLLMPVIKVMRRIRIPIGVAAFLSLSMVIFLVFVLADIIQVSITDFINKLPTYQDRIDRRLAPVWDQLTEWNIIEDLQDEPIKQLVSARTVAGFLGAGMVSFFTFASKLIIVFFITLFVLMESLGFKEKVVRAYGKKTTIPESVREIGQDIQRYIFLKTLISFTTGLLTYIVLTAFGLDFALLWAFLTFCLNFIPNLGSILATIPPVMLAAIQFEDSLWPTVALLICLGSIQIVIGNFIDPRIMGQGLRLSTLVVFLSLVFFGWLWGFTGMLLAVPIMVSIKVIVSHQPQLQHVNILLER
jgi:predicted PurR-regulated permease PerM